MAFTVAVVKEHVMSACDNVLVMSLLIVFVLLTIAYFCYLFHVVFTQNGTVSYRDAFAKAQQTPNFHHQLSQLQQRVDAKTRN